MSDEKVTFPAILEKRLRVLAKEKPSQFELVKDLCSEELGQTHLFEKWLGEDDVPASEIRGFSASLEKLNKSYPGGLRAYILNAKKLLSVVRLDSKEGINPLDGWSPSVPKGQAFDLGTKEYLNTEKKGIRMLGKVGFVLVAGGLGERLGYKGAKIGLPTETTTGTSYIQYYCEYIKAVQNKMCAKGERLPLCIMVSNDTKVPTFKLLKDNKCFGLRRRQIFIVEQGIGVPALGDNDARIVLENGKIVTKPHGHGDIHTLLYEGGITKKWEEEFGTKYMVLFQDTNGLAFHSLPLMIGVSETNGFIMNSLAIPRKAKQAVGAITKLTNAETGAERTINVEYNQLDPLLRTTSEYKDGDVNDRSGFSPFPGNINQLVFQLEGYNKVLERTKGVMPDFVNPKYADASKTTFKKPTRLECMMQDFPTVLEGDETTKVGYTQLAANICFSPVKNSVADGVLLQSKGIAPGTAATGEADQYAATRLIMKSIGCKIEDAKPVTYNGITVVPGPAIVMKPDVACCPGEYTIKFPTPEKVKISARSTLVIRGPGVTIESLELDGALIIDVERGEEAIVRDLVVTNDGWVQVPVENDPDEKIAMRGFRMDRKDARYIEVQRKNPNALADEDDDKSQDEGTEYILEEQYGCALYPVKSNEEVVEEKEGGCHIM
eukprot:Nitzschia sp. Nitz4//scaffold165_size50357//3008//5415//NITZ4_007013-RA/size50357-processed-gene-0.1-mRNA-1//1//CDS//3329538108//8001//frame0